MKKRLVDDRIDDQARAAGITEIVPKTSALFPTGLCGPAARRSQSADHRLAEMNAFPSAVFEPEDIVILHQAFDEACEFLKGRGMVGPNKRREVSLCILSFARRGMWDPHRLALKAIVEVG